jgi:SAM-dependent methyltransferase
MTHPNVEQTQAWNGDEGRFFIAERLRHERMRQPLTERLFSAAAIAPDDTVLDIGCGCGDTTRAAARAASRGRALGVDLSEPMLSEARRVAAADGLTNASFRQADAQTCAFNTAYDVVISSLGVMFFDDPAAAFANIAAALRPGGRLAFLCWREARRNQFFALPYAAIAAHLTPPAAPPEPAAADAPGPFSLADPDRVRDLLRDAGFGHVALTDVQERVRLGADVADVIAYYRAMPMARDALAGADTATTNAVLAALITALRPHHTTNGVLLGASAWLVTARR